MQYTLTLAQARLQKVIDFLDAGGAGSLVLGTSALSGVTGVLATFALDAVCGTISVRTLTFSSLPKSAVAAAAGTAAKAEFRDSTNNVILGGLTVGLTGSGSNIVIDTTAIVSGRTVQWLSGVILHP